jgi:hypothetical protein
VQKTEPSQHCGVTDVYYFNHVVTQPTNVKNDGASGRRSIDPPSAKTSEEKLIKRSEEKAAFL